MTTTLLILLHVLAVFKHEPKKPKLERTDQKLADRIISLLQQHEDGNLESYEETTLETCPDEELDPDYDPEECLESTERNFAGIGSPQMVLFGGILVAISKVWEAVLFYPLNGLYRNGRQKRRKPSSMFAKFKFLKTDMDLRRLVDYEKAGEIKPDSRAIIAFISAQLYERTIKEIRSGHILHDSVLRSIISEIIDDYQIETDFYGSPNWLNTWKRAHRISSRRITTFVSKKRFLDKDVLLQKMDQFVKDARVAFQGFDPLSTYNLDQSGFQKELFTKRTLAETGTETIEIVTSSATGITHSYTVLPMLRLDGLLHPKLYVVFAEPSGSFPQNPPPYNAPNLVLAAAKGHIMGKDLMADFFERVVFTDDVADDVLLVADSWPCWRRDDVIDSVRPPNKKVKTIIIPPGATGQIQPLDIGIFRQFKKFMKNLTEYAQRKEKDFKPHQRDSIIKVSEVSENLPHFLIADAEPSILADVLSHLPRMETSRDLDSENLEPIRRNIKLFFQTVLQDSLFFIDIIFTFQLSGLSTQRAWQFISVVGVWGAVYMLDGLIMLMFSDRLTVLKSSLGLERSTSRVSAAP
ncbi:hypothetical protein B9Z55_016908 [Caenorhabditis nigoni]|uniref:DDE-1 domain-containing protein n=1 Tax=Caenorhabditis nigoni TaxID=1611254 RepID=A0A2G5T770_9PELO|nr:hypothetical protein B9Z55_016908 [Caenorhabditis nigoni]